jgi:Cellulose binding domain/Bacterial Ig domain
MRNRAIPTAMAAVLSGTLAVIVMAGPHSAAASALAAAPAAAPAPAPSPTAAPPYCQVRYQVNSDWGSGFSVSVTITYNGPQISNWTMQYGYAGNQALQTGWNGNWSQSGTVVTVTNAAWNGSLPTGGAVQIGANFTYSGTNAAPTGFLFNGVGCGGPCTGDVAPVMTITSPAGGATFTAGSAITLQSSPLAGCAVVAVSYSVANLSSGTTGSTQAGISFSWPYTVVWTPQAPGTYSITARAYTTGYSISASTTINVVAAGTSVRPGQAPRS